MWLLLVITEYDIFLVEKCVFNHSMYDSWIMDEIVHWICLIFPFFSSLSTNLYCTYYSYIKYIEVATGFLFWNADEFHTFLFRLQVSLSFLGVGWLSCCFMHVVHYRFSGSLCQRGNGAVCDFVRKCVYMKINIIHTSSNRKSSLYFTANPLE